MKSSFATTYRDSLVGHLSTQNVGERIRLAGWVHRRRDLGGLIFVDLRDRSGLVQLSFGPDWTPEPVLDRAHRLGSETVIAVEGTVVSGNNIGFRIERFAPNGTPVGTLVVRIDGRWVETDGPLRLRIK